MQPNYNYRHKNRVPIRNLKSIYFDSYTNEILTASQCTFYPSRRPYRYIFLFQSTYKPNIHSKKVKDAFKRLNIKIKRDKNLPF